MTSWPFASDDLSDAMLTVGLTAMCFVVYRTVMKTVSGKVYIRSRLETVQDGPLSTHIVSSERTLQRKRNTRVARENCTHELNMA